MIPKDAKLTPWPDKLLKRWEQLTPDEKKMYLRQVDIFAAYVAYTDHEIGRVIQAIEDMGKLDNTLIIYINGDKGTSSEGTLTGTPNEVAMFNGVQVPVDVQLKNFYDAWGSDRTYNHMAVPWVRVFDTPFSWTKQVCSHLGGVRQGMAIAWPKVIRDKGGIRHQFHHVIDIIPTILEASGIRQPEVVDGIRQSPIEGVSMMYTFDKANENAPSTHKTQYFEMMGDRALYHEGWIASTKVIVLPGTSWTRPLTGTPDGCAPSVLNASYNFNAEVDIPQGGAEGVLITQGGTGVPKVDGRAVATQKMEHAIPFILQWDENLDIGSDTGTPVDDKDYQVPFTFTGKFSKVTLTINRPKLTPADEKKLMESQRTNRVSE